MDSIRVLRISCSPSLIFALAQKLILAALILHTFACAPTILVDRDVRPEYVNDDSPLRRWGADLRREMYTTDFTLRNGRQLNEENGWELVFSFIHVSDVQIRDNAIIYHGRAISKISDQFVGGTERLERIDTNDEWPFVALVGGLNRLISSSEISESEKPAFLIHTGDAIEVATQGELLRFISIANSLDMPWLNVIGNHDVYIFGNFTGQNVAINKWSPGVDLLVSKDRFMRMHGFDACADTTLAQFYGEHKATALGNAIVKGTKLHGFDGGSSAPRELSPYYSIPLATTPPIRLLVLDTTVDSVQVPAALGRQVPAYGAGGYIGTRQFSWLEQQLVESKELGEAVLIFGHHPLSWDNHPELKGFHQEANSEEYLLNYLKQFSHVLGYFGGHKHRPGIFKHQGAQFRSADQHLIEVIAPSLHLYPQLALHVKVLRRGNELAVSVNPIQGVAHSGTAQRNLREACLGALEEDRLVKRGIKDCWLEDESVRSFTKVTNVPISLARLTEPRTYEIYVRLQPMVSRAAQKEFSFQAFESDENCSVDREASQTFCLEPGWRILDIRQPQTQTANCGSRVERTERNGENCLNVVSRVIGCGNVLGAVCMGRGWVGYTVSVLAEQLVQPLPIYEEQRTVLASESSALTVAYPTPLPEGSEIQWHFDTRINIKERGTTRAIVLSQEQQMVESFSANVEGGRLIIDFP